MQDIKKNNEMNKTNNLSVIKVDDEWFEKHGFKINIHSSDNTDNGRCVTSSLKLFELYEGTYGTRSYKRINIEHHNTIVKERNGRISKSNWYILSASGNGFEISGRVKYTKYTEEEIINVLNVIGLCIK